MHRNGALDKHDVTNDRLREELLGRMCAEDGLFFTSRYIFGRDRLDPRIHRPLAIWNRAQLMIPDNLISERDPRGSGKSTMLVEDKPAWLVLQPPVPGTLFRGLDSRIALMAPRFTLASIRVSGIKRQLENEVYREIAGDIVRPDPEMWSTTRGLRLMRKGGGGEPTVLPLGLDSIATQLHPPLVIIDDAVHEKNWQSSVELARSKMCVVLAYNLVKSERGVREVIGNIWAIDDVQDSMRPSNPLFKGVKVWERGLFSCEGCVNGRPNPDAEDPVEKHLHRPGELKDPIIIQLLRPGSLDEMPEDEAAQVYADLPIEISSAQFDNAPVPPGTALLDWRDLRYWEWYRAGDPNAEPCITVGAPPTDKHLPGRVMMGGVGLREVISLSNLDFFLLIDPAPTEEETAGRARFAFVVLACERNGPRIFLMEEYAKNRPPHENYNAIIDAFLRWPGIRVVDYESVGYQATIGDSLRELALARGVHTFANALGDGIPRIASEGRQMDRIRYTLMPWFSSGVFYISPSHKLVIGEVKTFGIKNAVRDLLDAISNLVRVRQARARRRRGIGDFDEGRQRRRKTGISGY